jgi:acyl-CoA dehydrogenase
VDFHLSEEQLAVQEAARAVFDGGGAWADLASANLVGLALPEAAGGSGLGMLEVAVLLEEQGRAVAPLPVWPTVVTALAIDHFGLDRDGVLARVVAGDAVLSMVLDDGPVPYAPAAEAVLVGRQLLPTGEVDAVVTTDGQPAGYVNHRGAIDPWVEERVLVALCALQVGVCDAAVRRTATYVSQREQFGKPIATFQAVAQRLADAYIDVQAMRATMLQAAWRLDAALDAVGEVRVAKWWASTGGHRVVHAAQHLHGGLGSDIDYPIHRYFLWGKHLTLTLGGASAQLAALADVVAV